uniref:Uncharacterized protein n=1 Tax=Avena sativa TaxID=4498 RepID=A0ACD5YK52_AVESA
MVLASCQTHLLIPSTSSAQFQAANPAMAASVPLAGVALLLLCLIQPAHGGGGTVGASSERYLPVRTVVYRPSVSASASASWTAEAAYAPFELCMGCRCCPPGAGAGNDSSSCVDTSCCYGIDCNIPGKPFGTCGFTPRTCGCGDAGGGGGSNCTSAPAPPS